MGAERRTGAELKGAGRATRTLLVALASATTLMSTLLLATSITGGVQVSILPPTGVSQALTLGNGPLSIPGPGGYDFWVPCTSTIHCATGIKYHDAVVTITASDNNTLAGVKLYYWYGSPGTIHPGLAMPHGTVNLGSTATTMTFSAWFTQIVNPSAHPVDITFSYTAVFENYGN